MDRNLKVRPREDKKIEKHDLEWTRISKNGS